MSCTVLAAHNRGVGFVEDLPLGTKRVGCTSVVVAGKTFDIAWDICTSHAGVAGSNQRLMDCFEDILRKYSPLEANVSTGKNYLAAT